MPPHFDVHVRLRLLFGKEQPSRNVRDEPKRFRTGHRDAEWVVGEGFERFEGRKWQFEGKISEFQMRGTEILTDFYIKT